jgi:uncharacterized protein YbjT (DUF2867 family)
MIVAVTGGTGSLGRHAVRYLIEGKAEVRVLSRTAPAASADGVRPFLADLDSGEGVAESLAGADTILHLATDPQHQGADLKQTRLLLERARKARVKRIVLASIVGIDTMRLGYYRTKLQVEEAVRASGMRWLIVRSTQFHSFVDRQFQAIAALPLPVLLPENLLFQTIDEEEVGRHMAEATLGDSDGYGRQLAGPERLTLGVMAEAWVEARGIRLPALPMAVPERPPRSRISTPRGSLLEAYRAGLNLPGGQYQAGSVTWQQYLKRDSAKSGRSRRRKVATAETEGAASSNPPRPGSAAS